VQYVKGKMGVGQTIGGVVRIFTVAVGIGFTVMYCIGVYLCLTILICNQVTIVVVAVPEGLPLAVTLT
jgi:P-type Ca2+ transporter type 2C